MAGDRFDRTIPLALLASLAFPRTDRPTRVTALAAAALSAINSASRPAGIGYPGSGCLGRDRGAGRFPLNRGEPVPVTRTPNSATHTATVGKFFSAMGTSGKQRWAKCPNG